MTDAALAATPAGLPAPADDGACDHLPGRRLPALALPSTAGGTVDLAALPPGRCVIYAYPMTGRPGAALPEGWDAIPGARGCTPQSCGFRDHHAELLAAGAAAVFGLSAQAPADQAEASARLHLPFPLLSDEGLDLARALDLPTFEAGGARLIKRLTLIARDGAIEAALYPVFPPGGSAVATLAWLRANPAG